MNEVEIVLGLLVVMVILVTIAHKIDVPYPVLLVLGGLALGFLPGLPQIELRPDVVFLIFLPPLLYIESFSAPLRDFRRNLRPIASLAIGLVLATTCIVAYVAHAIIPGLSWPLAFVLGAVVAPTDEIAVTEVAQRLHIPGRVMAIIEGESLINDAVSVVAYRMAIAAAVTGAFSLWKGSLQFLIVGLGGVAVGLAVGWCSIWVRQQVHDTAVENTLSLLTPFAAYLPAEALGVSSVISVVAAGLYVGRQAPRTVSSQARVPGLALWTMISFLLNGLLFILTGLQIRYVLRGASNVPITEVLRYTAIITLVVILVRFVWVYAGTYLPRLFFRRIRQHHAPPWQEALIVAWAGIRGGISLATALAIPYVLASGARLADRSTLIFIAFGVILVTLVVQGLSMPWLIRWMRIEDDGDGAREENAARLKAVKAALDRLDKIGAKGGADQQALEHVREHYVDRAKRYAARHRGEAPNERDRRAESYRRLRRDLIRAEREEMIRQRDEGQINEETLLDIQRDLDLEELTLDE